MTELRNAIVEVVRDELAKTAVVPEERIREIVREELAAHEKRQQQVRRFGLPVDAETKTPRPRVDEKLIGKGY